MNTTLGSVSANDIPRHPWLFARSGGVDQVVFRSGADIANLDQLDLKLWLALAMPTRGIEFDPATLDFIDTDKDGRVRPVEIEAAVKWARDSFNDLDPLIKGGDAVELANIKNPAMRKGAERILATLKKADSKFIQLADVLAMAQSFSQTQFNGDAIVPADSAHDEPTAKAIGDIVAALGGVTDRSGKPGVDAATVDKFYAEAQALSDWYAKAEGDATLSPVGEGTPAALAAMDAVRAKVNDYFGRCRLAAFDSRAVAAINRQEAEFLAIAAKDLTISVAEIADFPLAKAAPNQPLPLRDGLNPAWMAAMAAFVEKTVEPLLGTGKLSLSEADWAEIQSKLAPYAAYVTSKPATGAEKLGLERLRALLAGKEREAITALITEDAALKGDFDQIVAVEKLVRFQRDLVKLLNNYVSFADFYGRKGAIFQMGTLYLDARACHLCVDVTDPAKHATLAALAGIYLAYCDITRAGGKEKKQIVAAFTDGDSDNLMVGRNGVFYDRKGLDWDATITKVVANPISLREAFWSPYKKLLRMIEEMVAKRAAAADAAANAKLAKTADIAAKLAKTAKTAEPKKIDVGTVAALGVAVGTIGAAITALATGLMGLAWWQIPLVFVAIILVISLPSVVIAWLKLRRRNIAPVLDANGWAINTRARINTLFGASLTDMPRLPAGSSRSLDDPFAEKRRRWGLYILLPVVIAAAVWICLDHNRNGHYFWQEPPAPAAEAEAAPVDAETAAEAAAAEAPAP